MLGLVLVWRARAALVKGVSMGLLGLWVAGNTLWHAVMVTLPAAEVMGVVGVLTLGPAQANGRHQRQLFALFSAKEVFSRSCDF